MRAVAVMHISREDGYCGLRGLGWKEAWVLMAGGETRNYPHTPGREPGPASFVYKRISRLIEEEVVDKGQLFRKIRVLSGGVILYIILLP